MEKALSIFYPKCRKKDLLEECTLNDVEVCALFEHDNPTKNFPSLPRLKVVLKGTTEETRQDYSVVPKNPWQSWLWGMNQDPYVPLNSWILGIKCIISINLHGNINILQHHGRTLILLLWCNTPHHWNPSHTRIINLPHGLKDREDPLF